VGIIGRTQVNHKPRLVRRHNGRYYWVWETGEFVPYIGGGAPDPDKDQDDPADDPDDPDDDDDDADDDKTFSQADVNRIIQKKERKLRRSIQRELEEDLGVSLEEAKSLIKKFQEGEKPDAMAEINRLRQQLEDREQELNARDIVFTVREKLQEAGIMPARLKRAVRLVDLDEDPDDEDIVAAIEELKEEMPELFESEVDEDQPPRGKRRVPSSEPKPPRRKPVAREDAFTRGAELAKQFQSSTF
jgi:hypothetical protein